MRREGSKQLEEERELLRQQVAEELHLKATKKSGGTEWLPRLKIKWKVKKGEGGNTVNYSEEALRDILSKYGNITFLIVSSKKKGSALVEFETPESAQQAVKLESGNEECPLTVSYVEEPPTPVTATKGSAMAPAASTATLSTEKDYESLVLMKLRQAEERKNLTQQLMEEDS